MYTLLIVVVGLRCNRDVYNILYVYFDISHILLVLRTFLAVFYVFLHVIVFCSCAANTHVISSKQPRAWDACILRATARTAESAYTSYRNSIRLSVTARKRSKPS